MKKIFLTILLGFCMETQAESNFTKYCIPCHKQEGISLQRTFMAALLVYGGKENMKAGLAYYFKNPQRDISVMEEYFVRTKGVKKALHLSDKVLDDALEEYWNTYTVVGKLQ